MKMMLGYLAYQFNKMKEMMSPILSLFIAIEEILTLPSEDDRSWHYKNLQ